MKVTIGIVVLCFLFSCVSQDNSNTEEEFSTESEVAETSDSSSTISRNDTLKYECRLTQTSLPILTSDTVLEENQLPNTENLKGRILFKSWFHSDEIKSDESSMKWVGLFKAKDYFLSKAEVTILNHFDPVLDVDSTQAKTGWKVVVKEGDVKCEFMFAKLPKLEEVNRIKSVKLPKTSIIPGDTFHIQFGKYTYKIYATGYCVQPNEGEDYYEVGNFRLFMEEEFEGEVKKQLIMTQRWFNENVADIIFAGDLDRDERLDIIIDKSYHYNAYMPTLFLSGMANKGAIVKCAASRTTLGC